MKGIILFDFFFQAEDGIRVTSVTGVQTCALPISSTLQKTQQVSSPNNASMVLSTRNSFESEVFFVFNFFWLLVFCDYFSFIFCHLYLGQIGRASCRERA